MAFQPWAGFDLILRRNLRTRHFDPLTTKPNQYIKTFTIFAPWIFRASTHRFAPPRDKKGLRPAVPFLECRFKNLSFSYIYFYAKSPHAPYCHFRTLVFSRPNFRHFHDSEGPKTTPTHNRSSIPVWITV